MFVFLLFAFGFRPTKIKLFFVEFTRKTKSQPKSPSIPPAAIRNMAKGASFEKVKIHHNFGPALVNEGENSTFKDLDVHDNNLDKQKPS